MASSLYLLRRRYAAFNILFYGVPGLKSGPTRAMPLRGVLWGYPPQRGETNLAPGFNRG